MSIENDETLQIVNILLLASDALRNLINDVFNSNDIDISEHLDALRGISCRLSAGRRKGELG